ncbi:Polyprenol reductase [Candida viswanathii]|uniref:Polyprenal reductase n=1 Tax=Candida viswanathii TaxID=5486 RepID=A0A367XQN1_9ASCO|nr:Polyprenol reductase [Candida viswanathii]
MAIYQFQLLVISVYLVIAGAIYAVKFIKPLNDLLRYGKTTTMSGPSSSSLFHELIDFISSSLVVPKSWFTHFYITLFTLTSAIFLSSFHESASPDPVKFKNLMLIHRLLWVQGLRRLTECLTVSKFSTSSKMNFSHYAIGLSHYILISLATYLGLLKYGSHEIPDFTVFDAVLSIVFGVLSLLQFSAHYHLASLIKYTVPDFAFVASPHYFYEILIYAVLLIFSVKDGYDMVSLTFASAWFFVVSNLTISSVETYRYYQDKFKEEFKLKWAIFPGIL